jgi:histidine ammonia-lyase
MRYSPQQIRGRAVKLDARPVSLDALLDVALHAAPVRLSVAGAWRRRIERSRAELERMLRENACVYGVSTGVGNSSSDAVDRDGQVAYARSVMAQHGCGVGEPFPEIDARAIVFARLVTLAKGLSGVRLSLLEALSRLLNHGITPVIPRFGSVGASGDLTPLSYVAAAAAGEREVFYRGRIVPAARALRAEGLRPFAFAPKETLSIMNGTSAMTAVAILTTARFEAAIATAERASALAVEVLLGRSQAFDARIHAAKPHPGQVESARRIERALSGSRLVDPPPSDGRPVQDRYSLRCSPQVLGAARDAVSWANELLAIELNSGNDNPLVDAKRGEALFGGNFFGGHPALAMDLVKIAAASVADLVDRQFALLVDRHNSMGLPDTLVAYEGCGVKGLQITCSALTALAVQRAAPDSVLSRPTECGNQDKVSMGLNAAVNARDTVEYLASALAAGLIALSNAAVHRDEHRVSPAGRHLLGEIRALSPVLREDRRLDTDIARLAAWIGRRPAPR